MNNTEKIFNFTEKLAEAILTGKIWSIDKVINIITTEKDLNMQDETIQIQKSYHIIF